MTELNEGQIFACIDETCEGDFRAPPPDSIHVLAIREQRKDAIKKVYKCSKGHTNTLYWIEGKTIPVTGARELV